LRPHGRSSWSPSVLGLIAPDADRAESISQYRLICSSLFKRRELEPGTRPATGWSIETGRVSRAGSSFPLSLSLSLSLEVPAGQRPAMESSIDGRSARAGRTFQSCDTYQPPRLTAVFQMRPETARGGKSARSPAPLPPVPRSVTMLSVIHEEHSDIYLDRSSDAARPALKR